jgi:hypothetical protein
MIQNPRLRTHLDIDPDFTPRIFVCIVLMCKGSVYDPGKQEEPCCRQVVLPFNEAPKMLGGIQ